MCTTTYVYYSNSKSGITHSKFDGIWRNSICGSSLQSIIQHFSSIPQSRKKKVRKTKNGHKRHNFSKHGTTNPRVKLDLKVFMVKLHTNFQINISKHKKKSPENCFWNEGLTDKLTDGQNQNILSQNLTLPFELWPWK